MSPETKDPEALSPYHSGAQNPSHHKTQRTSSRTQKQNYSCSHRVEARHLLKPAVHPRSPTLVLVAPALTADLVSEPDSRKPQLPRKWPWHFATPAPSLHGPKICPSEMTLRHTWFDVHSLMEGPERDPETPTECSRQQEHP